MWVLASVCPTIGSQLGHSPAQNSLENAQHGAKNVTSVAIKIISVHSAGLSSQEPGAVNPAAHSEDTRAKVNPIIPGLEASW